MGRPPSVEDVEDLLCNPPRLLEVEDDQAVTMAAALEARRKFVHMAHTIMQTKEEDERSRESNNRT